MRGVVELKPCDATLGVACVKGLWWVPPPRSRGLPELEVGAYVLLMERKRLFFSSLMKIRSERKKEIT